MDCAHQAFDPAQRLSLFEVAGNDAVDPNESGDGRFGRLRTQGLLGIVTCIT